MAMVFTTMAVRDGQVLWADYHWQRLASHAVALQLDIATPHLVSSLKSLRAAATARGDESHRHSRDPIATWL